MGTRRGGVVPKPAAPASGDALPRVLCFALRERERSAVLRVLRGYGSQRSDALLAALGIERDASRGKGGAHER